MTIRLNKYYTLDIKKFLISTTVTTIISVLLSILCILFAIFDFKASLDKKSINTSNISYKPLKVEYELYTVQTGDTLWNIAESMNKNIDTRYLVDLIKEDNNKLNSNLRVGEEIKVRI